MHRAAKTAFSDPTLGLGVRPLVNLARIQIVLPFGLSGNALFDKVTNIGRSRYVWLSSIEETGWILNFAHVLTNSSKHCEADSSIFHSVPDNVGSVAASFVVLVRKSIPSLFLLTGKDATDCFRFFFICLKTALSCTCL